MQQTKDRKCFNFLSLIQKVYTDVNYYQCIELIYSFTFLLLINDLISLKINIDIYRYQSIELIYFIFQCQLYAREDLSNFFIVRGI